MQSVKYRIIADLIAGAQYSREQAGAGWELYLAPTLQYRFLQRDKSMSPWVDVKQVREGDEEQPEALRIEAAAE